MMNDSPFSVTDMEAARDFLTRRLKDLGTAMDPGIILSQAIRVAHAHGLPLERVCKDLIKAMQPQGCQCASATDDIRIDEALRELDTKDPTNMGMAQPFPEPDTHIKDDVPVDMDHGEWPDGQLDDKADDAQLDKEVPMPLDLGHDNGAPQAKSHHTTADGFPSLPPEDPPHDPPVYINAKTGAAVEGQHPSDDDPISRYIADKADNLKSTVDGFTVLNDMEVKPIMLGSPIQQALHGYRGKDQAAIAGVGMTVIDTLLKKNMDYGSSVFQVPRLCPDMSVDAAIRVRLSDKLNRLEQLLTQEAEVTDETMGDTILDVIGYMVLWLVSHQ